MRLLYPLVDSIKMCYDTLEIELQANAKIHVAIHKLEVTKERANQRFTHNLVYKCDTGFLVS